MWRRAGDPVCEERRNLIEKSASNGHPVEIRMRHAAMI